MADFPTLTPSLRTVTPGAVAQSQFRAYGGQESRAQLGAGVHGHTLSLSFSALTFAQAKSIRDHYLGQQGSFVPFDLPSAVWSGFSAYASILPEGYQWIYAEPPQISDTSCEVQSANVRLVAVFNFVETGFTLAPYDGDLTPTTGFWDAETVEMCSIVPEINPYGYTYARWNGQINIAFGVGIGTFDLVTSWQTMSSGQYLTLASQSFSAANPNSPYPSQEPPWVRSFDLVQVASATGATFGMTVAKCSSDGTLLSFAVAQKTVTFASIGDTLGYARGVWEFTNDTGAGVQASFDGLNDATP